MSGMATRIGPVCEMVIVTDYGAVRVSPSTTAAMNAQFPGWDGWGRGDLQRAALGQKLLLEAATAVGALAWEAGQELVEI